MLDALRSGGSGLAVDHSPVTEMYVMQDPAATVIGPRPGKQSVPKNKPQELEV